MKIKINKQKKKINKMDITLVITLTFISIFYLHIFTQPGLIKTDIDIFWLLFGFIMIYIIGITTLIYDKKKETDKNA